MPISESLSHQAEAVRSFNRFYTRQIGVLDEGLLASPFTLTQARVLFELGTRKTVTAGEIGELLGLDAGYLSRMVQGFMTQGLLTRQPSKEDGRQWLLSLTNEGRKAFRELDRTSHQLTASHLSRLSEPGRHRLLASMKEVQRLLSPANDAGKVVIRTHRIGDIGWAIERHGQLYADEFHLNEAFEALVATLFAQFASKHDPAKERMWVAEVDGERMGCVFVVRNAEDPTVAQLRCLLVDPKARGLAIGKQLVDACIAFATEAGYARMMLWTNDILVSARRIYQAAGFSLVSEEPHHSFGHDMVGQVWMREFGVSSSKL
ncbi:bifunctional helix-turn-helix transcriptional regulator/GNAT family N-acetyltransferase [Dyella nitratireducens]|uniref:GNAT family N-acetyltransferase n=1 Tax=Dyella nitratireducens TaxID=1849580 RepID=A0ABQ1FRB4_9GAMM|nr:helix-turn-helix domain-containing GNAT family N-acetyltransferase [Dyella nitratireducens]GGA27689.1 GNAT family N-acetyltransferase [Dyella nitratireducens]GLQ43380.1 GNAT family N-acetyltransferase [Dyella nitratireducens]